MKKVYFISLLLVVVAMSIILSPAAGANMLTNYNFEMNNTDDWAHWCVSSTISDTEKHSGFYSIELGLLDEYGTGALIQEAREDFSIGKPLYASAWIKTDNFNADAFLKLEFWDSNGECIKSVDSKKITGTKEWTKVKVSVRSIPADTTMVKLLFQLDNNTGRGSSGKVYFDDIYLDTTPTSAM